MRSSLVTHCFYDNWSYHININFNLVILSITRSHASPPLVHRPAQLQGQERRTRKFQFQTQTFLCPDFFLANPKLHLSTYCSHFVFKFQISFIYASSLRVPCGLGWLVFLVLSSPPCPGNLVSSSGALPSSRWAVEQTWDLSKNWHARIFGPKILHTKSA